MGNLVRDGISYSSGGAAGSSIAKNIKYDNSESGLSSVSVQGAIDEVYANGGKVNDVQIDGTTIVSNKIANIQSSMLGKVNDVKVNGTSVVTNKVANIPKIPTRTSDLTNNSGYITDDTAHINRIYSDDDSTSYTEMETSGINVVLSSNERVGIGEVDGQQFVLFGSGISPGLKAPYMVKKFNNGIWIGDDADLSNTSITSGTGFFVDISGNKLFKYNNGVATELATAATFG